MSEFIDWGKEKLNAAWNALPNGISIERNYSIGPQIGFEVQTPATAMQAELKLASFDIGQRKLEKKDGKLVETTTLGYTRKTEVEGSKPVYEDIGAGNVENSMSIGLSAGKIGFSKEIGQKQDIRICAGCEGSSNTRRYSKSTTSAGFATLEKTKYLDGSGQTATSLNLFKVDIRAIFGVEIKVGLDYNKQKEDK
jgi:hypothetical protein